jgi:hypothetical protein
MARRWAVVLGGGVAAVAIGVLIERLIVTDHEAILIEADACAEAISAGDVSRAADVFHPAMITEAGDARATRARLEAQLKELPLEKVNFLLQDLVIEGGVGRMQIDVFVFPKSPKEGVSVGRFRMLVDWEKDGDRWKVRRAEIRP